MDQLIEQVADAQQVRVEQQEVRPKGKLTLSYSVTCTHCGTESKHYTLPRYYVQSQLDAHGWEYKFGFWFCKECAAIPHIGEGESAEEYTAKRPALTRAEVLLGSPQKRVRVSTRPKRPTQYCLGCGVEIPTTQHQRKRCEACAEKYRHEYALSYSRTKRKLTPPATRGRKKREVPAAKVMQPTQPTQPVRRGGRPTAHRRPGAVRVNPYPSVIHLKDGQVIQRYIEGKEYTVGMIKKVNYMGQRSIQLRCMEQNVWHWDMLYD